MIENILNMIWEIIGTIIMGTVYVILIGTVVIFASMIRDEIREFGIFGQKRKE